MHYPIKNWSAPITLATLCSLAAISQARADHDSASVGTVGSWYKEEELSIDFFGSGSIGQQTIDHLSGSRVSDSVRLGLGAGVNYFITRYLGVGGDVYTENTDHYFADSTSVNFIGRLPIGESGLAPYAFAGVGYQFDRLEQAFGQLGVGVEVRFHQNWSIFTDARYVLANRTDNYGLGRMGVRFVF